MRNAYIILMWKPEGRSRRLYQDNIKRDHKICGIECELDSTATEKCSVAVPCEQLEGIRDSLRKQSIISFLSTFPELFDRYSQSPPAKVYSTISNSVELL
jgi:hypothetical protein